MKSILSRLGTGALSLAAMAAGSVAFSAPVEAQEVYIWVRQSTPPVDVVRGEGTNGYPLCRFRKNQLNHANNGSWQLGWFDDTRCIATSSGSVEGGEMRELQFLVPTPGHTTRWVQMVPGLYSHYDTDALVGAFSDYEGRNLQICSEAGTTGHIVWGTGGGGERGWCETHSPNHPGGYPPVYKLVGSIVSIYE